MKTINMTFTDKEFKKINKVKLRSGLTWEKWLLEMFNYEKTRRNGTYY